MKQNLKLDSVRGSIFVPFISYSWSLVNKLLKKMPSHIPSLAYNNPVIVTNKIIIPPGCWALTSPDKSKLLLFQQDKVDYIVQYFNNPSMEELSSGISEIHEVLTLIFDYCSVDAVRLAIAPTFVYDGLQTDLTNLAKKVFIERIFKNSCVDNCDFSQVFRVEETFGNKTFLMNYLSHFYYENKMIVSGQTSTIKEVSMLSLDINTHAKHNYIFDKILVDDFFNKSVLYCKDFISFYFE